VVDPIVLVALCLLASAALALAPIPTALAAMAIAAALRRRAGRAARAIALGALLLGGLRARAALARGEALHERATALLPAPSRCEGEGTVMSSPVVMRGRNEDARSAAAGEPLSPVLDLYRSEARIDVAIDAGTCGEREIPRAAPLYARLYGAPEDLARGDRVAIVADLAPVHLFLNEGSADPRPAIARSQVSASGGALEVRRLARGRGRGLAALVDHARAHVRARIEATYHPEARALGRALILGETDLDPLDDEAFRMSGLSHLLAVSGTHLVIAVAGFAAAFRAILVRVPPIAARIDAERVSSACAVPAAWLYADFAGGSGSALRAAAMLSAAMLTRALGKRPNGVRSFAWSLLIFGALDPLLVCDVSFALSAAATAGLTSLKRPIAAFMVRGPAPVQKLLDATATTLAAMAGCTPILMLLSPTLPLLGLAANLVAAPLGELAALPICLAHAALGFSPAAEQGAAWVGSGALLGVRAVARLSASTGTALPVPRPTPAALAVIAITVACAWATESRRRRVLALLGGGAAWALCEAVAIRAGAPHGLLRISVLDVGQGDASLVDLPDGSALLVDGGGFVGSPVDTGVRVLLPVLRARRRSALAAAVLSHPHPDHFGGLVSTLPAVSVGALWDSGQGEDQGAGPAYAALLAGLRARRVPVLRPADLCGAPRAFGGATVEVLAPCPSFAKDEGANDNSLVLRITYGRRRALLVGDAEHAAEEALAHRYGEALRADLLKVGHHGSRTSTSAAFLDLVSPEVATISCGVRNRFGHPHPNTLATLAHKGVTTLRTDRGGEIVWETDGERVLVSRPAR
jgi:competence protein ComEC